jgi:CHASE3 domain sensor protein
MRLFRNLPIAKKLILAFSFVLALMAVLGAFSVSQMGKVNQTSTDMADNWMPSVRVTLDMNTNTSDYKIAALQHVLSQDAAGMQRYEEELAAVLARFEKNAAEYDKLISSPDERALWNTFQRQWAQYLDVNKRVLALSRANKTDETMALMRGEGQKAFDESSATLLQLGELNVRGGRAASDAGDVIFESARMWSLVLMAGAIVLGLGLAIWIARSLSHSLNQALG